MCDNVFKLLYLTLKRTTYLRLKQMLQELLSNSPAMCFIFHNEGGLSYQLHSKA